MGLDMMSLGCRRRSLDMWCGGLNCRLMKGVLGLGKRSLILDKGCWGLDRQAMMSGADGGVVKGQLQ